LAVHGLPKPPENLDGMKVDVLEGLKIKKSGKMMKTLKKSDILNT
jgi:hypothetical protein